MCLTHRSLWYKNVRFVDSSNYMQMPLSKFAKAFSLPAGIDKLFFPFLFNSSVNRDYNGPFPPRETFAPENFNTQQLEKFNSWYPTQQNSQFNLTETLLDYCIADVNVLRIGCLKFMRSFMEMLHVNPFIESVEHSRYSARK